MYIVVLSVGSMVLLSENFVCWVVWHVRNELHPIAGHNLVREIYSANFDSVRK